jgi:hypothetical protein
MASSRSITRLHAADTKPEPVQLPKFGNSQADVPGPSMLDMQTAAWQQTRLRRRFGRRGPETRFSTPALMSTMHAPAEPDRSDAFGALAARDRAAVAMRAAVGRWQERQARTGAAEHQQHGPLAIQV